MTETRFSRRDFLAAGAAALLSHGTLPRILGTPGPLPSPQQLRWQQAEFGMFIHFGINTFTGREWGEGKEDPALFNPASFDAVQWIRAAKSAGCRYVVLTAKHHDGFCLWPSRLTLHSVKSSPWRGGKGDVVREFVEAARREGVGVGLYLSPWDRHEPCYGDTPRYNDFYCGQLTELLSWYGPIMEVWFDGANGEGPNGKKQVYDWERIHRTARSLQPEAVMFSDAGPDIRWVGNEDGSGGDPNWCTVDPARVPAPGFSSADVIDALQHGDPPPRGSVWRPAESDVSIRPGWFWHAEENEKVKSTGDLFRLYCATVGRNTNLLLNVPPNRDGRIADGDVARLAELGSRIARAFEVNLASGAHVRRQPGSLELELNNEVFFNTAVLSEGIAAGQSVSQYALEIWQGGHWVGVSGGTTIGQKKIDHVAPVSARKVRLSVTKYLETPVIGNVALYRID
jgi:alpha-L-fucosidase